MAGDHPSLIRQTGPIALRVGHARNIEGSTSWRTQSSRSVVLHADPRKPVNKFEAAFRFVLVDCQPSTTSALSLPFPPPLFPPLPFTIFASSRTTRYFSHPNSIVLHRRDPFLHCFILRLEILGTAPNLSLPLQYNNTSFTRFLLSLHWTTTAGYGSVIPCLLIRTHSDLRAERRS